MTLASIRSASPTAARPARPQTTGLRPSVSMRTKDWSWAIRVSPGSSSSRSILLASRGEGIATQSATGQIDLQQAGVVEHREGPHLTARDPRGGQLGLQAVLEFQPGNRHIQVISDQRPARSTDRAQLGLGDLQQDVQIVDHQLVHHAHVAAPARKGTEPVHADEARPAQARQGFCQDGVEALQVAHLDAGSPLAGQLAELLGPGQGGGQRLFHQTLQLFCPAAVRGHRPVGLAGNGHHRSVGQPGQQAMIDQGRDAETVRGPLAAGPIDIDHRRQHHFRQRLNFFAVVTAEIAHPYHGDPCSRLSVADPKLLFVPVPVSITRLSSMKTGTRQARRRSASAGKPFFLVTFCQPLQSYWRSPLSFCPAQRPSPVWKTPAGTATRLTSAGLRRQ